MDENMDEQRNTRMFLELQDKMDFEAEWLEHLYQMHRILNKMIILNSVWLVVLSLFLIYKFR